MNIWHTCEKCRKNFTHKGTFLEHIKNCKGSKKTQQNNSLDNSPENKTNPKTILTDQTEKSK
jgi:hypothetical protein